ncbi:MAG: rane-associated protein in eicosanoid and glutathione metabolism [Caulobacteraceae bacterium]|nr:rane-associated protein in eicosanoid and glutathione metabolism [Caulobacteraceae bacterium]
MNHPHDWTAIVTVLALIVFIVTAMRVGAARGKHGVAAPAMSGHELFDRHFRVQMNTLEQLVLFLPSLWLFDYYWGQLIPAILGVVWIVGRIIYMQTYVADPAKRSAGFGLTFLPSIVLLIGALVGAVRSMMITGGV